MAHFANVKNGVVVQVIVAEPELIRKGAFGPAEQWVQTSYGTRGGVHYGPDGRPDGGVALRKNYAGVGSIYDAALDAFYAPQPFASWKLNKTTCRWEPPVPYPQDGGTYSWNENLRQWVLRT